MVCRFVLQIMQARVMLRTIKHVKPERFVLENVSGMKARGCLDEALTHMARELSEYTIIHFDLSPNILGVCLLRPRIYFIGVRTSLLLGRTKQELQHVGLNFIKHISSPVGADFITFLGPALRLISTMPDLIEQLCVCCLHFAS